MNPSTESKETKRGTPSPLAAVKALAVGTCVRFTVIAAAILIISALASLAESDIGFVDNGRFLLLLPLSLILTFAARVRRSDRLPVAARCILHPVLTLGGGYLCAYLPYQISRKPSPAQVLMIVISGLVIYLIVMGIYLLVTRKKRQKAIDETPYQSQFGSH